MSWLRLLRLAVFLALIVLDGLDSAESRVYVHFSQTPPLRTTISMAVFRYSVQGPDGSDACESKNCSFYCQLDGKALRQCPASLKEFRSLSLNQQHTFVLNVTSWRGEASSSTYSWFIDTIRPTAIISSKQNYTNAKRVTVDVTFSEACAGNGGIKCLNSSSCDVIVNGPAHIDGSSLRTIKPGIEYQFEIILFSKNFYNRVVVALKDGSCSDAAGNSFAATNSSTLVIHFDRGPVLGNLRTSVPSYELDIHGIPRTVFTTNRIDDLRFLLEFRIPIVNSTKDVLNALVVNSGHLAPIHDTNIENRRFDFQLKNVSVTDIVTVKLSNRLIISITGTPASSVTPITFLYDSTSPMVSLSTSSPSITKNSAINVIVEFTKPVFGFDTSMIGLGGCSITRFTELSRALYSLTLHAETDGVVHVILPAGRVNDISGNPNLVSNRLEVKHYLKPLISMSLHSFITVGTLATSLASSFLSISIANLETIAAIDSFGGSGLSTNLCGMIGHLQTFALSDGLLISPPIKYSETMKGLRWIIPRERLPWKRNSDSNSALPNRFLSLKEDQQIDMNATTITCMNHKDRFLRDWIGRSYRQKNISTKHLHGPPLSSSEYFTYFLRGEPLSANNVIKKLENYKGWEDLETNLFWLGVYGVGLIVVRFLIVLFLGWRTRKPAHRSLLFPRFELLLLILMLSCISQSAAFVIRGGTTWGSIVGALLLAVPAAFILSICLFLVLTVFSGTFVQYKEVRQVTEDKSWYKQLQLFFAEEVSTGKWVYRNDRSLSFLRRFGILFENQKGPSVYIFADQNGSNEEVKAGLSGKIRGCAQLLYIIIDLIRRSSLGFVSGIHAPPRSSQTLFAFIITLMQFSYLITLRPYIRRGTQTVETISLSCEAVMFGLSIFSNEPNTKLTGTIMLSLFFFSFVAQLTNAWYDIVKSLLKLSSQPEETAFVYGLKFAVKGFVLPCLPRNYWPEKISGSLRQKPGAAPARPLHTEAISGRRDRRGPRSDSFRAMTATVVPVCSPSSPSCETIQIKATIAKQAKGHDLESKSEMKKLSELAKDCFSRDSVLPDDAPQPSTSKTGC